MLTGKAKRLALAKSLDEQANQLHRDIWAGVMVLKPIGRMSELGMVLNVRPTKGICCSVPGSGATLIFAKARTPSPEQLERWDGWAKQASELRQQAAKLDAYPVIVRPHCTIGNQHALERDLWLLSEGLLDPDEVAFVTKVQEFWHQHPEANWGIVNAAGEIVTDAEYHDPVTSAVRERIAAA